MTQVNNSFSYINLLLLILFTKQLLCPRAHVYSVNFCLVFDLWPLEFKDRDALDLHLESFFFRFDRCRVVLDELLLLQLNQLAK